MEDIEALRVYYEGVVNQDPTDVDAVHFLGMWHLDRQSYYQVRILYFGSWDCTLN